MDRQQRDWFADVSAKFKAATGATVTFEAFASPNEELTKVQTSVLSSQGPDIYSLGTTFTPPRTPPARSSTSARMSGTRSVDETRSCPRLWASPVPTRTTRSASLSGDNLVVAKYTKNKDLALALVKQLTSADAQALYYRTFGELPTNAQAAKTLQADPALAAIVDSSKSHGTPFNGAWTQVQTIGTGWALFITYLTFALPFSTWVMVTYLRGLPPELDEAARLDGASSWRILVSIVIPLSWPGLVVSSIFAPRLEPRRGGDQPGRTGLGGRRMADHRPGRRG